MDQDALSEIIMLKTNDAALAAFIARKAEIDAMLERLVAFSADQFEYSPVDVNWAHVGTLEHYRAHLHEITDNGAARGRARLRNARHRASAGRDNERLDPRGRAGARTAFAASR